MTTVAQLIAKLQTLPQDAEVEVLEEYLSGYYNGTRYAPVDIENVSVLDFTDYDPVKSPHVAGKVFVHLEAQ